MKIAIVNDLPVAVEALRRALAQEPGHEVVWVAQNGAEAVELCARQRPELLLMDLLMPGIDGVETIRRIMTRTPCAILVVTASTGANACRVFDAMGCGALDAVDTPVFSGGDLRAGSAALLAKINAVGRLLREKAVSQDHPMRAHSPAVFASGTHLVAIGASAGGPAALSVILQGLTADFPAAVVVVQHVDVQFAAGMAEWLNRVSPLPVRLARGGDAPAGGTVLLAGTNDHLVLGTDGRLAYTPNPRDYVYRPSADVFFQSASLHWQGPVTGVLLTGMGRDGAVGLKALRNQGHCTIAQDEATSAVYGMPKAAAALGAAVHILPLGDIAARLSRRSGH